MDVSPQSFGNDPLQPARDEVMDDPQSAADSSTEAAPILFTLRDLKSVRVASTERSSDTKQPDQAFASSTTSFSAQRAPATKHHAAAQQDAATTHRVNETRSMDFAAGATMQRGGTMQAAAAMDRQETNSYSENGYSATVNVEAPRSRRLDPFLTEQSGDPSWIQSIWTHKRTLAMLGLAAVAAVWSLGRGSDENEQTSQSDFWTSLPDDTFVDEGTPLTLQSELAVSESAVPQPTTPSPVIGTPLAAPTSVVTTPRSLAEIEALFTPTTGSPPESSPVQRPASSSPAEFASSSQLPFDRGTLAAAVSSRSPSAPDIREPTLADLEFAARAAGRQTPIDVPSELRQSQTPHGIADWLQYLPSDKHYRNR